MPPKPKETFSENYRKPPAEFQFEKGKSGNPKGRPPKATQAGAAARGGGIEDRLAAMMLEEAMRLVQVKEGNKVFKIPAMQAVLRATFSAAARGEPKAMRQLSDLIPRVESARMRDAAELLGFASQYKERYQPVFETHAREGLDPPEIYPHPDDMIIDESTGEVIIDGPTTKDQAGARKAVREQAIQSLPRYFEVQAALAQDPTNRALKKEFKELSKYPAFLEKDAERKARHEALRRSRQAMAPTPAEPKDNNPVPPIMNEQKRNDADE